MFRFKSHILWIILEGFWFKFSETPVKTLFLLTSLSGPGSRSGVFSPSGALGTTSQLFSRADPRRFRSAQIQQHEKIRSPQGHPDRPGPKLCREAGPCLNAAPLAVGRGGERAHSAGEGALGPSSHGPPFPPVAGGFDFAFSIRFDVRTLLKAAKGNRCFCSEGGSERCWSSKALSLRAGSARSTGQASRFWVSERVWKPRRMHLGTKTFVSNWARLRGTFARENHPSFVPSALTAAILWSQGLGFQTHF